MVKNKKPHQNRMASQKADLAVKIYRITKSFPDEELNGLTSQLRRAGISGPSNPVK
jgi:four helix bundle protein